MNASLAARVVVHRLAVPVELEPVVVAHELGIGAQRLGEAVEVVVLTAAYNELDAQMRRCAVVFEKRACDCRRRTALASPARKRVGCGRDST